MKQSHVYLTGYRGCGKSTAGKLLAARLDLPYCDLDDDIEATAGMTIAEIFAAEGEPGFRDRETACLTTVSIPPRRVISLGGGAILRPGNCQIIAATGWCVWLDADPAEIAERLATDRSTGSRRPALTNLPAASEIVAIMQQREPLYRAVADYRVDTTSRSVDEIVDEIIQAFEQT
jgi:shikimate kinase